MHSYNYNDLSKKLEAVLLKIQLKFTIEDDTIVQKFKSTLKRYVEVKKKSKEWFIEVGLLSFVDNTLKNVKERSDVAISIALHIFSIILKNQMEVLKETLDLFVSALPEIKLHPSCLLNALEIISYLSLGMDEEQINLQRYLMGEAVIPALQSRSIYVKKKAIGVISDYLIQDIEYEEFQKIINLLDKLIYESKFENGIEGNGNSCRHSSKESEFSRPGKYFNVGAEVYAEFFIKVMATSEYSSHRVRLLQNKIVSIPESFGYCFDSNIARTYCKLMVLASISLLYQRYQSQDEPEDKRTTSAESVFARELSGIAETMLLKGHALEFTSQCSLIGKYLASVAGELAKRNLADSDFGTFLDIVNLAVTKWQILPLQMNLQIYTNTTDVTMKNEYKFFADIEKLLESYWKDQQIQSNTLNDNSRKCLSYILETIPYLPQVSLCSLVDSLSVIFEVFNDSRSGWSGPEEVVLKNLLNVLKGAIERLEISSQDCPLSPRLLESLCTLASSKGLSLRVKISCVKCIQCIFEVLTLPQNSECVVHEPSAYKCCLQPVTGIVQSFVCDTEWEVRDCALELVRVLLDLKQGSALYGLQRDFVVWFRTGTMIPTVFEALGDVEPYVQASALKVLSSAASVNQIWPDLESKSVSRICCRAVLRSEDEVVKESALHLLNTLLQENRIKSESDLIFSESCVGKCLRDANDRIRGGALECANQLFRRYLAQTDIESGVIDAIMDGCISIESCFSDEQKKQIVSLMSRFGANGFISSIADNVSDSSAADFLGAFKRLIDILDPELLLKNSKSMDRGCISPENNPVNENQNECLSAADSMTKSANSRLPALNDRVLDWVLDGPDSEQISKLRRECDPNAKWWSQDSTVPDPRDEEFGPKPRVLSLESMPREIERALTKWHLSSGDSLSHELELDSLLDDILLTVGVSNESQLRDCY